MKDKNLLDKENKNLVEEYAEDNTFRALIQGIPFIGSYLDMVFCEKGTKWKEERINTLFQEFGTKIANLIGANNSLEENIKKKIDTEEFYDLFIQTAKKVIDTRQKDKIEKFANILKNYLISSDKSEEEQLVEHFVNITAELSEEEFCILMRLQTEPEKVHFLSKNTPTKLEPFIKYLEDNGINYSSGTEIPREYIISNIEMYLISKLERLNLIYRDDSNVANRETYSSTKKNGLMTTTIHGVIHYSGNFEIRLSYIGEKYLHWIMG